MTIPYTIAVSGKGGTGKTTLSALLVKAFIEKGEYPVLAVDAAPNANLHEALGVTVVETLGGMREQAFMQSIPPGMNRIEYVKYRFRQVLVEAEGFDLIAMGRPEGTGCYCFANDLLKTSMQALERTYRFVVIDSEAGMEHISRGTIGLPHSLLIVSDPGARGIRTAVRIRDIAAGLGLARERMHLVINRYSGVTAPVDTGGIDLISTVPPDPAIERADLSGNPIVGIPGNSPAYSAVKELSNTLIRSRG